MEPFHVPIESTILQYFANNNVRTYLIYAKAVNNAPRHICISAGNFNGSSMSRKTDMESPYTKRAGSSLLMLRQDFMLRTFIHVARDKYGIYITVENADLHLSQERKNGNHVILAS